MIETYHTREQPDDVQRREPGRGAGTVQQTETEWSQLIATLELAQLWQELIREFIGEDAHPRWRPGGSSLLGVTAQQQL